MQGRGTLEWPKQHQTSQILLGIGYGYAVTIYKTIPTMYHTSHLMKYKVL